MVEASIAASPASLPPRIGRYEVLCELGQGGMAVLYLARTVGLGGFERLFAIKMIHEHLGREPGFVRMFLDEARLVARIRHPNVIQVYEVDVDRGRYYISMDYFSGETLGAALTETWPKNRPFPIPLAAQVVALACEGLHAAHELRGPKGTSLGVIHRDISPQNIMLGYDGTIRVMDFGVAKALDQLTMSRPGTFKGTPAYMSPEQIRGETMDRRSDIFGLGVILWEATVGKRLFKDKTDIATAARVLKMKIPPPSTLVPKYPVRLEQVILRATARDPGQRHQTARELADDLHEYLAQSGKRVSAGDIESFMVDTFPTRLKERRDLEHRAMLPVPSNLSLAAAVEQVDPLGSIPADADTIELDGEAEGAVPTPMEPEEQRALPMFDLAETEGGGRTTPETTSPLLTMVTPREAAIAGALDGPDEILDSPGTGLIYVGTHPRTAPEPPLAAPKKAQPEAPVRPSEEPTLQSVEPLPSEETTEMNLSALPARAPEGGEPELVVPVGPPLPEAGAYSTELNAAELAAVDTGGRVRLFATAIALALALVLLFFGLRATERPAIEPLEISVVSSGSSEPKSPPPPAPVEAPAKPGEITPPPPALSAPAGGEAQASPPPTTDPLDATPPKDVVQPASPKPEAPAQPAKPRTPKRKGTNTKWSQPSGATLFNGSDL